ncbi:hypothetical protein CI592_07380 [Fischerella thermalis CCMEE 5328]|nr:hypothetical protein CI592_07380 [Fischerella thermalis CCMEE 5328]
MCFRESRVPCGIRGGRGEDELVLVPIDFSDEVGRWGDGEVGRWGGGELGAPTPLREWGLGAMGRWGVKMLPMLSPLSSLSSNLRLAVTNLKEFTNRAKC